MNMNQTTRTDYRSFRALAAMDVLEGALDVGDDLVIAACRRVLTADRIGWHKHGNRADLALVMEFMR